MGRTSISGFVFASLLGVAACHPPTEPTPAATEAPTSVVAPVVSVPPVPDPVPIPEPVPPPVVPPTPVPPPVVPAPTPEPPPVVVPPPPVTFSWLGGMLDALSGGAASGVRVSGAGASATSDGAGLVDLVAPVAGTDVRLRVEGPGYVPRDILASLPGHGTVSLIPTSLDLDAFDAMFRQPMIRRWRQVPPVVIERRVLQFTTLNTYSFPATESILSDDEFVGIYSDLADTYRTFTEGARLAAPTGRLAQPGDLTLVASSGQITVARVRGMGASGTVGYAGWEMTADGTITGGYILLDETSDLTTWQHALRQHEMLHVLGAHHVTTRLSVMNPTANPTITAWDLNAMHVALGRSIGNLSPDIEPDGGRVSRASKVWVHGER